MVGEKTFAQGITSEFTIGNVSMIHVINNFSGQPRQEKSEDHRVKVYIKSNHCKSGYQLKELRSIMSMKEIGLCI